MRALITGPTGFVGSNLIVYLEASDVKIMPIARDKLPVLHSSQMLSGDCVIHLAGKAHDLNSAPDPDEYYKTNFELTKKLYDEFLKSDADKFIFISSAKAVADHLDKPLTEDHTPNPKTHYGKSKLMAEQYIMSQSLPIGKSVYILRPCMIHGPGNKGNINLLYKFVIYGVPYVLAAFNNKRSFLSIDNLCFLISEIMTRDDLSSGIYNVADNETLSTSDLVTLIGEVTGKRVKLWKVSKGLMIALARFGDLFRLPLTTERLNKLTENYIVDNSKIRKALRKAFPTEAREGLINTLKSF